MASQYSHLQFFRSTPNALLGRYFSEKHGVLQEIDFGKLKEREVESIFQGFTALPSEKQAQIEAECQDYDGPLSQDNNAVGLSFALDFTRSGSALPRFCL